MKRISTLAAAALLMILPMLSACTSSTPQGVQASASPPKSTGQIYLYGEVHSKEKILEKELELWSSRYHDEGLRHLFVEFPYYTAEFLNLWMQADNDDILNALYVDWEGTMGQQLVTLEFYRKIKNQCPETIFHGTDVGHQYQSTGERYLKYLRTNHLEDSDQYRLAQETVEQGKRYKQGPDGPVGGNQEADDMVYREGKLVENFIREFDKLNGESVMGFYGAAHTRLDGKDSVYDMAVQLQGRYGDAVHSEDLSLLIKDIDPYRTDILPVAGKDYTALYFGSEDVSTFSKDYRSREFWRLENAYEEFKEKPKTGDVLPYDNYPMLIEAGQVFVIDYTTIDGSVVRLYHRSDGNVWLGQPTTEGFTVDP